MPTPNASYEGGFLEQQKARSDGECVVPECRFPPRSRGLCSMHYQRWAKGKEFPGPIGRRQGVARGQTCFVDGCEQPVRCVGLCGAHYSQGRRKDECPNCGGQKSTKAKECRSCFTPPELPKEKKCRACNIVKPLSEFSIRNRPAGQTPRSRCRACDALEARAWQVMKGRAHINRYKSEARAKQRAQRPEAWAMASIRRSAKKLGLSIEELLDRLETCRGLCEVCHQPATGKNRLAVDHDHLTGKFRGFLCGPHNTGMGMFGDDPDLLRAAADYLERFGSTT